MTQQALGLIETCGLVAAIEAADAALKAAAVELVTYEKVTGGLVMIAVVGEVAAVQAAIAAGSAAAARVGQVVSQHVIPRPMADIAMLIRAAHSQNEHPDPKGGGPAGGECSCTEVKEPEASHNGEDLASMSVIQLRKLARRTEGIAIKGRQIAKANKEQLIAEIQKARTSKPQ